MASHLRVIPSAENKVLDGLQSLVISTSDLQKHSYKFAFISTSHDKCKFLCRLNYKPSLHQSYCYMDTSVLSIRGIKTNSEGLPIEKIDSVSMNSINISSIEVIEKLTLNIKIMRVSVVFESIEGSVKWQKYKTDLKDFVRTILEMFVIPEHSLINLNGITSEVALCGIASLVVHCNKMSGACGRVTSRTNLDIVSCVSRLELTQLQELTSLPPIAGLEDPYKQLKDVFKERLHYLDQKMDFRISPSSKVLLMGPPGCGKTTLVKHLCTELQLPYLTISAGSSGDSSSGEAEAKLRAAFKNVASLPRGGVLLLEDLDCLCRKRTDETPSHVVRLSTQLMSLLEDPSGPALVVATTSRPEVIDGAIRRPGRLDQEIVIAAPDLEERVKILQGLLILQKPPNLEELCKEGARLTPGYVAADLQLLVQDLALRIWHLGDTSSTTAATWEMQLKTAVGTMRPASLRGEQGLVSSESLSLEQLGGLHKVKKKLRDLVEIPLKHPEAYARMNVPRPKGVLLYGPPGCAKTSLVRALAHTWGATFLAISAAQLYSPFVGDTERCLLALFQRARATPPAILFIDEIDALVGSRGEDKTSGVQERVLSTLLTELDGISVLSSGGGVMVVASTNRPDLLDAALMRPGRLDALLYVPAPDLEDRLDVLKTITRDMPLAEDVDLSSLAERTNMFSGADLQSLCREAALGALTEEGMSVDKIEGRFFTAALEKMSPSLNEEELRWYETYRPGHTKG